MSPTLGVTAVVMVTVATLAVGTLALRLSRTTSDFFVASRTVGPMWNASAIGGEYLSAASFLGVAGLVLAFGVDMLWYPVGFTAGYLVLLTVVSAPLRRSGAYTLPDFAESRLESLPARRLASLLVVGIGWLYLLPQLQGAGLTLRTVTGAPGWLGSLLVAGVVVVNVLGGGMRSITFVQAFQYWLKLTAIALPVVFCLVVWRADGTPTPADEAAATFREATTVTLPRATGIHLADPVTARVRGVVDGVTHVGERVALGPGRHKLEPGTSLTFPAGSGVPRRVPPLTTDADWAQPAGAGQPTSVYATYSLMIALLLGTMGLPHVAVRFYTNPDGRAARRTALAVLGLLSLFYLFPVLYGVLGRVYLSDLLLTGRWDTAVLELPGRIVDGLAGELLAALATAGAFAAFLSTSSGLVISVTGVISQDVLGRVTPGVRSFRVATVAAVGVPVLLAAAAQPLPIALTVGLAFTVAASTFCPLLVLGIWWPRLTDIGAMAGLLVGGATSGAAVVATIVGVPDGGWLAAAVSQPAAWTVPLAFITMVVGSRLTGHRVAPNIARTMVRLHTPEQLAVDRGDWRPAGSARSVRRG